MNNKIVVAGTVFRVVLVWELETGELLRKLEGHNGVIFDCVIMQNGIVTSVSDDRTVRVWTGDSSVVMYGHTSRIWKVREMDGNRVVTVSEDATVRIWCAVSGKQLAVF